MTNISGPAESFHVLNVIDLPDRVTLGSHLINIRTVGMIVFAEVGYSTVVTTKLDVYSYGVLLLELLTGRQPADDPIFGESLHVVAWVKDQVRPTEARMSESVLDPALLDEKTPGSVKEEMLSVQRIALLCAKENPTERPAMKHVVEMFTSLELRRT